MTHVKNSHWHKTINGKNRKTSKNHDNENKNNIRLQQYKHYNTQQDHKTITQYFPRIILDASNIIATCHGNDSWLFSNILFKRFESNKFKGLMFESGTARAELLRSHFSR